MTGLIDFIVKIKKKRKHNSNNNNNKFYIVRTIRNKVRVVLVR